MGQPKYTKAGQPPRPAHQGCQSWGLTIYANRKQTKPNWNKAMKTRLPHPSDKYRTKHHTTASLQADWLHLWSVGMERERERERKREREREREPSALPPEAKRQPQWDVLASRGGAYSNGLSSSRSPRWRGGHVAQALLALACFQPKWSQC